ncbi:MAG TPA: hypothetical protein VK752_19035 [Bryobacteraceae bacterium]|jgi:hypothetical protein|nr:hypothetical protein [Bryobacteraceae bacterium]
MKKLEFALCLSTFLFFVDRSAAQSAQWTATSAPAQATIAGGPWTLSQGGSATSGGAFDGPVPYCTPGNSSGGAALVNPSSTVNTFNPYYFPFVVGSGQNVKGYFDYRPKNINEAVVAATSTNAGQSWTFQEMVEQLTTECPNSDANTSNSGGNDDGAGHPSIISFGGTTWLYTLDRRSPHVDSDGLIVHNILPRGANALNPLPLNSPFMQPPTSNIIAGWNFNNLTGTQLTPAPSTGSGAAHSLGMTNGYTYTMAPPNVGSVDGSNVTKTTLSSDPSGTAAHNIGPNNNEAWRIVGAATTSAPGNGWNLAAPPCTQGAEFDVDTTGYHYIIFQYDWYTTNQGVRDLQALYTTDGSTWTPVGPIQVSGGGSAFNNQITINFHALGITGVENNAKFGVRLVSVFDPDFIGTPAYSIPAGGNVCSAGATGTYTAASLANNNQPVVYNNNSGNWRFDEVNVLGTANNTNPITSDPIVNTTGLVNPDGFLAVVPNTYPIQVLYISKTLNSDYVPPTSYPICPASIPNGNFNDDVEVVRIATTTNFINFTDITPFNTPAFSNTSSPNTPIQMVNGLSDPSTTSYSGIRWVSGNGTLIKLSNGNWGLFFGGGNCLDGDSDAFHAIMYAESNGSDLTNWTVINGINNPIASIATVSNVTDPQSGQQVTVPSSAPVIPMESWFGGRVYAPQAVVTSPGTVSLIFAGYNTGFQLGGSSRDLSSYRNIGQVNLSVANVTLP